MAIGIAGRLIELLIPGQRAQRAIGKGEADPPHDTLNKQLSRRVWLWLHLLAQAGLDISTAKATMAAAGTTRRQFIAISPQANRGRMHSQQFSSFAQAQPLFSSL